jgi:hypothetical protein
MAKTTLDLADVWVDAAPACERAHAWAVHPIGAAPVVLAAASAVEHATWISALRYGSPVFRAAARAVRWAHTRAPVGCRVSVV